MMKMMRAVATMASPIIRRLMQMMSPMMESAASVSRALVVFGVTFL